MYKIVRSVGHIQFELPVGFSAHSRYSALVCRVNDRPRDVPHKYSSPAVTPSSTSATKAGTDTPAAVTEPYAAPTIQKHAPKPHSQLGGALSGRVEAYRGGGNVAKSGALFCDSVCYRSLL